MATELPLEHESVEPERPREDAPAVVLLHGRGADERDLLPIGDRLPDDPHLLSLRAPTSLGPGYTWYDLDLSGGGLQASQPAAEDYTESLELIAESIDQAIDAYGLDPDRIGLLGFSQGAILSLGSMIERPGTYAWVAALHGYLPERYDQEDLEAATGTPVFFGAGERDQVIPATRAEAAAEALKAAGIDTTFRTYPVGHGTSQEELADLRSWLEARVDLG